MHGRMHDTLITGGQGFLSVRACALPWSPTPGQGLQVRPALSQRTEPQSLWTAWHRAGRWPLLAQPRSSPGTWACVQACGFLARLLAVCMPARPAQLQGRATTCLPVLAWHAAYYAGAKHVCAQHPDVADIHVHAQVHTPCSAAVCRQARRCKVMLHAKAFYSWRLTTSMRCGAPRSRSHRRPHARPMTVKDTVRNRQAWHHELPVQGAHTWQFEQRSACAYAHMLSAQQCALPHKQC